MGLYDDYKKLILPKSILKKSITTSTLNRPGTLSTGWLGNDGVDVATWFQERIDDGTITITGTYPTNLTRTVTTSTVTINSDTGTDAIIPSVTTIAAGVMTALDKVKLESLITLSGVSGSSVNLGSFSGSLISDNNTIKGALQELELSLETAIFSIPSIIPEDLISNSPTIITITGGVDAMLAATEITFNPGNVLLHTLGGILNLDQLNPSGATVGQILTFDGTDFVPTTYVPPIQVHNNLTGIQGGVASEYYHIPQSIYDKLNTATANKLIGRGTGVGQIEYITPINSVTFSTTNIQLVNDTASPGNTKYYGTDGAGVRGWFTLPGGVGTVTSVTELDTVDINLTVTNPTTTPVISGLLATTGVVGGTYGTSSLIPSFNVDSKGRLLSVTDTAISVTSLNVTDFSEAVDDRLNTLLVAGTGISLTYNDPANTLTITNTTASIGTGVANQVALWATPTTLTSDVDFQFDGTYLTLGTASPSSLSRFTSKGLGTSLSTYGYVHNSSANVEVFKLADNGAITIGALGQVYIHPDQINISYGGTYSVEKSGGNLRLYSDTTVVVESGGSVTTTPSLKVVATRSTNIANPSNAEIQGTFSMIAGSNNYTDLNVTTVVNQTGGTSVIRSVYINPTLTAATAGSYRGLEINAPGHMALKTTAGNVSFNLGSDATGDLYYRNASGNLTRIGIGGPMEVLGSTGTVPAWTTTAGSLPGGSNGDVLMYSGGAWVSASPLTEKQTGITGVNITLASTPLASIPILIFRNGQLMDETDDYTVTGTAVTLITALTTSDKITAIYYI